MVFAQTRASPNAALGWEGEQKQIKRIMCIFQNNNNNNNNNNKKLRRFFSLFT